MVTAAADMAAGLLTLDTALNAGPGQYLAGLRTQRDDHALRVEIMAARILVTVTALLGREKRNELRAFFPVKGRPKRVTEEIPTPSNGATVEVGGTQPLALPQQGAVVPAPSAGIGAKEGGEKGTTAVASGSMFGSRAPAPVLASGAGAEPAKAAAFSPPVGGSTGAALLGESRGAGVNGSSNGHAMVAGGLANG